MSLTAGTHLGPYEVLSSLGAGGMGEVYRARDTRLGREVAIKLFHPRFAADAEQLRARGVASYSRFSSKGDAIAFIAIILLRAMTWARSPW